MTEILQKILLAKDNRANMRKTFSAKKKISISFSLNIASYPKTNKNISQFFNLILTDLKNFLLANKIFIDNNSEINIIDEAGNFFMAIVKNKDITYSEIKQITEEFEENHKLGRFIDVDITDEDGKNVSSHKKKLCYFCNEKPAIVCMREKTHSYSELQTFTLKKINEYLFLENKNKTTKELSAIALKSILYEVSLSPKPGLVNFYNSGSHTDMNYYTFLNSSSALSQYFTKFAELGYGFNEDLSKAISKIRIIGLQAEKDMFAATNNINTQKGIIFLMGIALFSASYVFYKDVNFTISNFQETVKKVCKDIVKNELQNLKVYKTHGEKCFEKFGLKGAGARLEVELAFPTVVNFALPVLEKFFKENKKEEIELALRKTLLAIISENNDSNILYRKGEDALEKLKKISKDAFIDDKKYDKVCKFCIKENISPGGSADLLAVSLFLHSIKKIKNEF